MVGEQDGEGNGGAGEGVLPAMPVIQRFGGIRPTAQKLGVPVSTVQGWKERGVIPANRRQGVLAAALRNNIALEPETLTWASSASATEPTTGAAEIIETAISEPVPRAAAFEAPSAGAAPEPSPWSRTEGEPPSASDLARAAEPTPAGEMPVRAASERLWRTVMPAALTAALVALLVSATAPYWTRAIGLVPVAEPVGLAGFGDRFDTLEQRLAELESRPTPAEVTAADPELTERIEGLEQLAGQFREELDRLAGAAEDGTGVVSAPELTERLEAMSAEVAALKSQLEAIRRESAEAVAPERLAALFERIEENAAELRAMESELSKLVELPKRVAELGQTIEAASGQAARTAFVLASGQLEAALDSGQPYASELGAVRRLAAEDPELSVLLARLEEHSEEGIPTMAELRVRFDDTALAVAQAAQTNVDGGWADRAWARMRSLVTVRPVGGDVAGDSPEAHLARAEARLDEGDLASAVGELESLGGAPAEAAAPWLAGARARVAADQAIERLRAQALARAVSNSAPE